MIKRKGIWAAVAAIILLLIGTLVLMNIDTADKQESENDDVYTIYSEDASKIARVTVEYPDGDSISAVNLGNSVWTINDMSNDDIDSAKAFSLAGTVATLTSKNKIADIASDLSEYGLDKPQLKVTITKNDGESDTLLIGDMSPTLGEYFVMRENDNAVYTMYAFKVDTLKKPLGYYKEFNRFIIDIDDITDVKIEKSSETIEFKLLDNIDKNTNNVWEMISPYQSGANDDYIDNKILTPIEELTLITPEENAVCDFNNAIRLEIKVKPYDDISGKYSDEYTETLEIADGNGETSYVRYKNNVFAVSADSVAFAKESSFNIVSKMQALVDISLVKSVDVEYEGAKHTIEISPKDSKYEFQLDGQETDNTVSQKMYQSIISLAVDAIYNNEPMQDTILKITYNGIKKEDDTVVEIKPVDDLNCAMVRNGEAKFTLKRNKVDEFISLFEAYVKNPMSE